MTNLLKRTRLKTKNDGESEPERLALTHQPVHIDNRLHHE